MDVGAGRAPGVAHLADLLAALDALADAKVGPVLEVAVDRPHPVAVVQRDVVTDATILLDFFDCPVGGRENRRSPVSGDVDAVVKLASPCVGVVTVPVAGRDPVVEMCWNGEDGWRVSGSTS